MHGNVWEWCSDWYGEYDHALVTDPLGAKHGDVKVRRGGSASSIASDARSARRESLNPDIPSENVGLRIACVRGRK